MNSINFLKEENELIKAIKYNSIKTTLSSYTIELTPSIAKLFLQSNAKFQRKINVRKVQNYIKEIQNNNWQLNGETISFDLNNNMINGQHRCQAVVLANKSIYTVVLVGLETESFKTMDQGYTRSNSSLFTMKGEKYANVLPTLLKIIYDNKKSGLINSKAQTPSFTEIEKLYTLDKDNFDKACSISSAIIKSYKNTGFTSTSFAVFAYKAVKINECELILFFNDIINQNWTSREGCPIKACYQRIDKYIKKGQEVNSTVKFNILAASWNHYRSNKRLTVGMNKKFASIKAIELI